MPPELSAAGGSAPITIAAWLACAAFVVGLVNSVLTLVERLKEKPRPADTYVRIQDFSEHRQLVLARIEAMRISQDADRESFRGEVNELRVEIRDDLRRVHDRIDDLPSQIIATLKNTGALK